MSSTLRLIDNKSIDNKKAATPADELAGQAGNVASNPGRKSAEETREASNAAFVERLSQVLGRLSESDRQILLNAAERIAKT